MFINGLAVNPLRRRTVWSKKRLNFTMKSREAEHNELSRLAIFLPLNLSQFIYGFFSLVYIASPERMLAIKFKKYGKGSDCLISLK